jgi:uncharacterized protein YbaA (DUF1428 family)
MMTRKYYVEIAEAIRETTSITEKNRIVKDAFVEKMIEIFARDNPNFNPTKFREAVKTGYDK